VSDNPLSQILHSLIPRNPEELSLLQSLLAGVRAMHKRVYGDLGFSRVTSLSTVTLTSGYSASEELMAAIPAADKRYFDGLVEAYEIYHSIHGQALSIDTLSLHDGALNELRRIRDLCLEKGLGIF
jgi:hypothetical protein